MPGPFPGMDPYLESTLYWRKVHGHLLSDMTYQLNREIRHLGFVAQYEERCYLMPLPGFVYPDSIVMRSPQAETRFGSAAVAETQTIEATPPLILNLHPELVREPYIEIRTVDDEEAVVTVIELLSPSNKASDSVGRTEYLNKQRAVLNSRSNLLEIDLLRGPQHTIAAPHDAMRSAAAKHYDYTVSLHRNGSKGERFEVWPFTLLDSMPTVRVPLADGVPDALLALQPLFDRMYDESGVGDRLRYQEEPEPPLSLKDAVWVDGLLREKGLRLTV